MMLQTVHARYRCDNRSCEKRTREWELDWQIVTPGLVVQPLVVCVSCAQAPTLIATTRIDVEQ